MFPKMFSKIYFLALVLTVYADSSETEINSRISILDVIKEYNANLSGATEDNSFIETNSGKSCHSGAGICTFYLVCKPALILDTTENCPDEFEKCCAIAPPVTSPPVTKAPVTKSPVTRSPVIILPTVIEKEQRCGLRNNDGVVGRISGLKDNEANFGEFPWMVAVSMEKVTSNRRVVNVYQCGGSLIHSSVVLTVAHRIQGKNPSALKVRVGEWDTRSNDELYAHSDYDVEEIKIHDDYHATRLLNNIALLFLENPVEMNVHINTICLPPQGFNFDGKRCLASGWGKNTIDKVTSYQAILRKVELPVVPKDSCQVSLRKSVLGKYYRIHDSFICAGGEVGLDTCDGDGGSALVCEISNDPGYYYQAGIVSFGVDCGESGVPSVYVNVAKFREWIDSEVNERGYLI